jgi:hypothetical protein
MRHFHRTIAAQAVSETPCESGGGKACKFAFAPVPETRLSLSTLFSLPDLVNDTVAQRPPTAVPPAFMQTLMASASNFAVR